MTQFSPCARCHRHLHISEAECPFCGRPRKTGLGTSSLLAGALVGVAALGCNDRPKSKAPPPVERPVEPVDRPVEPAQPALDATAAPATEDAAPPSADASAPDAGVPDAAPAKKKKKRKKAKAEPTEAIKKVMPPPNMPYGAPPARKRLV